jgi:hypothetical protein
MKERRSKEAVTPQKVMPEQLGALNIDHKHERIRNRSWR